MDTPGGAALSLSQLEVTLRLCIAYRWSHGLVVSVCLALDVVVVFCAEYMALPEGGLGAPSPMDLLLLWAPPPCPLSSLQSCVHEQLHKLVSEQSPGCTTLGFSHFLYTAHCLSCIQNFHVI